MRKVTFQLMGMSKWAEALSLMSLPVLSIISLLIVIYQSAGSVLAGTPSHDEVHLLQLQCKPIRRDHTATGCAGGRSGRNTANKEHPAGKVNLLALFPLQLRSRSPPSSSLYAAVRQIVFSSYNTPVKWDSCSCSLQSWRFHW